MRCLGARRGTLFDPSQNHHRITITISMKKECQSSATKTPFKPLWWEGIVINNDSKLHKHFIISLSSASPRKRHKELHFIGTRFLKLKEMDDKRQNCAHQKTTLGTCSRDYDPCQRIERKTKTLQICFDRQTELPNAAESIIQLTTCIPIP